MTLIQRWEDNFESLPWKSLQHTAKTRLICPFTGDPVTRRCINCETLVSTQAFHRKDILTTFLVGESVLGWPKAHAALKKVQDPTAGRVMVDEALDFRGNLYFGAMSACRVGCACWQRSFVLVQRWALILVCMSLVGTYTPWAFGQSLANLHSFGGKLQAASEAFGLFFASGALHVQLHAAASAVAFMTKYADRVPFPKPAIAPQNPVWLRTAVALLAEEAKLFDGNVEFVVRQTQLMKRSGEDTQNGTPEGQPSSSKKPRTEDDDDLDDDYLPTYAPSKLSSQKRLGRECPYLDTVSRQALDFDFEARCSVSLSTHNVYACLVCGSYYQGRGQHTHAFTHALETGHHMFMKLEDGRVYCLPEGYEVEDRSLDPIRYVLNPTFPPEKIPELDSDSKWMRALDGSEYMPGLVGLNNMSRNDYVNVIVEALSRVLPLRNFFLLPHNYSSCKSVLVQRFGALLRKMWNPRQFKGQVSPHEFMQQVMAASSKRFTIEKKSDPVEFLSWLLNTIHSDLTGGKRKKPSIISKCFQGELEITTEAGSGKAAQPGPDGQLHDHVERVPFLMLALDLPPAPLYKDALDKDIIPQIPIFELLHKFDASRVHDDIKNGRRRYRLTRLPSYLVLHFKRFTKNNFFWEKNPTIVNFPVRNLELRDVIPIPQGKDGKPVPSKYDLVANILHEGKAGEGAYRAHVHRRSEDAWYEVDDLRVTDILSQMVALSEAYMQIYEMKQVQSQPSDGPVKLRAEQGIRHLEHRCLNNPGITLVTDTWYVVTALIHQP
ncbi:g13414 [Coccomyxa viridis]|uniref:G13414 protein n=1 Tax=Coccomyxa viridis TaxID=1274662 RepID=A0ABP1GFA7_9CHLO